MYNINRQNVPTVSYVFSRILFSLSVPFQNTFKQWSILLPIVRESSSWLPMVEKSNLGLLIFMIIVIIPTLAATTKSSPSTVISTSPTSWQSFPHSCFPMFASSINSLVKISMLWSRFITKMISIIWCSSTIIYVAFHDNLQAWGSSSSLSILIRTRHLLILWLPLSISNSCLSTRSILFMFLL